jgi:hypothetical protein
MTALQQLLTKGELQIEGLFLDRMCLTMLNLLNEHPEFQGALVYEAKKEDGFHIDSTNVHLIAVGALFQPWFDGDETYLVTRTEDDYNHICSLTPLEVKPMTQEEFETLKSILSSFRYKF